MILLTKLEYRLLDESQQYPLLYYFSDIDEIEVAARFACDYFVKEGVLYERSSCAMGVLSCVIYVKKIEEDVISYDDNIRQTNKYIRLEIRQFIEEAEIYPLVFTYELRERKEVLLYLQSDYFIWSGQEWQKTSSEIDEDRKLFVLYAKPTGTEDVYESKLCKRI
ncbi:hypothetical protein [Pelosinus sp. IPA-1]|uniref:hypothetical protein n=1 Tax=Pelosinus sp. IPA-1 TaxID=3029569 RepID=UPI0024361A75|nr:hypothetical protein [Pelosinus sp. IPA-1]GMA97983.1 hypothetical protein PIPA1_07830 [Pelosinus sp. IPA-1]